jgi:hypothetical protein
MTHRKHLEMHMLSQWGFMKVVDISLVYLELQQNLIIHCVWKMFVVVDIKVF